MNRSPRERLVAHILEWYFNYSSAITGDRSNWGPLLTAACFGSNPVEDPYNDVMLDAIAEKREIEKALFRLPSHQQDILYAQYGWQHEPNPLGTTALGPLYPICLFLYGYDTIYKCVKSKDANKRNAMLQRARDELKAATIAFHQTARTVELKPRRRRI